MIEVLAALVITGAIAAIGLPVTGNTLAEFRLRGDAQALANTMALAKMRAAAVFSTSRLYVDLTTKTYRVETWRRTGAPAWVADGGETSISSRDALSFRMVASPPPNTQAAIAQAPACRNAANQAIAGTACVLFNSRGIPVDSTGAPTGTGALYVSGDPGVWAVTVSATGQVQLWRTVAQVAPVWSLQ